MSPAVIISGVQARGGLRLVGVSSYGKIQRLFELHDDELAYYSVELVDLHGVSGGSPWCIGWISMVHRVDLHGVSGGSPWCIGWISMVYRVDLHGVSGGSPWCIGWISMVYRVERGECANVSFLGLWLNGIPA